MAQLDLNLDLDFGLCAWAKLFNLKWVVRRHAETKHPENFILTCSQCQTTLNSHPTLQRHFNKDTHKSVDGEEKREKKDTLSTQIREVIKIYKLLKRIRGENDV